MGLRLYLGDNLFKIFVWEVSRGPVKRDFRPYIRRYEGCSESSDPDVISL